MKPEDAAKKLSFHLIQCGALMPMDWIRENGEGSELQQAFRMALDALRDGERLRAELDEKEKYYDQMIDALAATNSTELEQVKRERDAAIDCIYKIEDALDRGNDNDWAREHISEWESQKED